MKRLMTAAAVLAIAVLTFAAPATAAQHYSSCSQLLKDYPRGVANTATAAATAVRAGYAQASVRASIYQANGGRLDPNDNGVMCEQKSSASGGGSAASKKAAYLLDLHERIPSSSNLSDDLNFKVGQIVCRTLDEGGNFEDIFEAMADSNMAANDAVDITFAAVTNLCPGHRQFLINYAATLR